MLHNTLAIDEAFKPSDHRCINSRAIRKAESLSRTLLPSLAAAASGIESAVYSAYIDHEAPQLLDQRTQTLLEISDVPGENITCFFLIGSGCNRSRSCGWRRTDAALARAGD
jgi:hypothetical protein